MAYTTSNQDIPSHILAEELAEERERSNSRAIKAEFWRQRYRLMKHISWLQTAIIVVGLIVWGLKVGC